MANSILLPNSLLPVCEQDYRMGYVLNYSARNIISKSNNILSNRKKQDSIVMEESLVTCPGVSKLQTLWCG